MTGSCSKCSAACIFKETKSDLFGYPCDMCKVILCRNCAGFSSTEIRALSMISRVLPYFCTDCITVVRELPAIKAKVADLQAEINELKEKSIQSKQSFADIVKIKNESNALHGNFQKLEEKLENITKGEINLGREDNIAPTIEEIHEREKRLNNLVIFGISEPGTDTENQNPDAEAVVEILKPIKLNISKENIKMYRLGKIDHNKKRPIKVQFEDKETVLAILKQKSKLQNNDGIYIKRDQTPMQRNHLKKLLQELEQHTKEGRNNYKIRYQGFDFTPKLVKVNQSTTPKN